MIAAGAAEFAQGLLGGGRLAGLDAGTRTIGLATCDAGWSFAAPHSTIARGKFGADLAALRRFVVGERIIGLVLGLPLNMDGSESPRSQSSRSFAKNIADLEFPILLWDERWSTVAAERFMIEADMSRAKRAERIDSAAAAHILQGAIDALVV